VIHILTKTSKLNQVVEQTTIEIQHTKLQLWDGINKAGKHIVDECKSKKIYAVREDPLTEEECQKTNMLFEFEGATMPPANISITMEN